MELFHKTVWLYLLGPRAPFPLAAFMLAWNDEADKRQCELTGAKRILADFVKKHGGLIDVILGDALYCCITFLQLVRGLGMHAVVRLKDDTTIVYTAGESKRAYTKTCTPSQWYKS